MIVRRNLRLVGMAIVTLLALYASQTVRERFSDHESPQGPSVDARAHDVAHRRVILDPRFKHVGIGVAYGAPERIESDSTAATYAVTFGRRPAPR